MICIAVCGIARDLQHELVLAFFEVFAEVKFVRIPQTHTDKFTVCKALDHLFCAHLQVCVIFAVIGVQRADVGLCIGAYIVRDKCKIYRGVALFGLLGSREVSALIEQ